MKGIRDSPEISMILLIRKAFINSNSRKTTTNNCKFRAKKFPKSSREFNWHLLISFTKIINYDTQKATPEKINSPEWLFNYLLFSIQIFPTDRYLDGKLKSLVRR